MPDLVGKPPPLLPDPQLGNFPNTLRADLDAAEVEALARATEEWAERRGGWPESVLSTAFENRPPTIPYRPVSLPLMVDRTDQAFAWTDGWTPVSMRLTGARRITLLLVYLLVAAGIVALFVARTVPPGVAWGVVAAALVVFGWLWWLIGRRVRSFGYAERDDDLLVTSGIMFRRLVVVPYGRMQLVDVKAGPIDRALGITTVQLHTAAATTDASIPGLEPAVSAALRDRLARRGEQRSAGL